MPVSRAGKIRVRLISVGAERPLLVPGNFCCRPINPGSTAVMAFVTQRLKQANRCLLEILGRRLMILMQPRWRRQDHH